MYDVIVIGAGVMGSAAAYNLSKRNKKTLLIDQFPLPHTRGSSSGASRITRQAYYEQFNTDIMKVASPMWRQLEEESGMTLYKQTGVLVTSSNQDSLSHYHNTIQDYYKKSTPLLDEKDISRKYHPMKALPREKACFDPEAGILYASKCIHAFQKVFERNGGEIADNHKLLHIVPGDTVRIQTDKREFHGKAIVIACGPWSQRVLSTVGIYLPLEIQAIQVLYWKTKAGADHSKLPAFINTSKHEHIYGIPPDEYNGMFKILYHKGQPCDPDLREQVDPVDEAKDLADIKEFISQVFPDVIPEPAIRERCLYTCTPDETAVVDLHPIYKNIAFAAGFSGQGFKQAPVIGDMLADLVLEQKVSPLLVDELRAARFSKKVNSIIEILYKVSVYYRSYSAIIMYDVIVIGAGVIGSAAAYNLSKRNKKTLLIDQFPLPHTRGSSSGASRVTRQAYYEQFNADIMKVAFPMWRQLEEESGTTLYKQIGMLVTSTTPDPLNHYQSTIQNYYKESSPLLDEKEISRKYHPMRALPGEKGCFDPEAGILYASKCIHAFQKVFERNGGEIADNHKLLRIVPGDTVKIQTDKREFHAKAVVIACGPWSQQVLANIGVHLPLETYAIQVLYWKTKAGADLSKLPTFFNASIEGQIYGIPPDEYNGMFKILFHKGHPCDPDLRDQIDPVDEAKDLAAVKEFITRVFPDIIPEPAIKERCMYTCTPDNVAVVDLHPTYKNIAFAAGFSGQGFKQAPVIGDMLADLVLEQKVSPLLVDELRAARFSKKAKL
ncbi:uncharacterized protein [Watersipora subatra]|uniref:uncharacterized protein n=1 Tax=Watersipora subatra TaxID=2589382 RepID=UPI00355AF5FE